MLVKGRMSHPVITIKPEMPIMDALNMMRQENIRRLPVVKEGKMVGIVTETDLLNAAPSDATTLSVWEVNYLIAKIKVADVMTKQVRTVTGDTPIEEAARIMVDNKIGGMPVMRNGAIVGLITETDLFKIFLELMGAREPGVRVTALVPDVRGTLDTLTHVVAEAGGSFIAFSQFSGESQQNKMVTFKVEGLAETAVRDAIEPVVESIVDIRC